MTAWILSIAGISVVSVLVDLILPSGQTAKYIKNIFAFITIFVIISPLPKLLNGDVKIDDIFESEEIILQEDFLYQVNRDKLSALESSVQVNLESEGVKGVIVSLSADIFKTEMQIEEVFVDLSEIVIDENCQHKDIKKLITKVVKNCVGEVEITFNE